MSKLAACYTIFNGEELLEKSMQQIDSAVDFFVLCYQKMSNKGEKREEIEAFMQRFKGNPRIVLVNFEPNLSDSTKENERKKHQIMLEYARYNGATHVLLSAVDHFYDLNQFKCAKAVAIFADIDVTFTKMFTYYKHPTWQLTPMEEYYMPFIIKMHKDTKITSFGKYPVLVDPSVKVNTISSYRIFGVDECVMHHYSMIRKDIRNKFKNAAASIRWKPDQVKNFIEEYENYDLEKNIGVSYFGGRKIKTVTNYFNL